LLVSKKRYVGLCFESPDQKHGSLDSKGIEIVRRDNCPAVGKMQEKALRLLFTTRDGSQVKGWLVRQWQALLGHRVRANDYIFAKVDGLLLLPCCSLYLSNRIFEVLLNLTLFVSLFLAFLL